MMAKGFLAVALAGVAAAQECQDLTLSGGGVWHTGNQPTQTCDVFRNNGWCPQYKNCCTKNENLDPERACCACGGGCTDAQVPNAAGTMVPWTDQDGDGCSGWAQFCDQAGSEQWRSHGLLPSEACCVCGGGSRWRPVSAGNPGGEWSFVEAPTGTGPAPTRTCSTHNCPANFVHVPGAGDMRCEGACSTEQCCSATCRTFTCPSGWNPAGNQGRSCNGQCSADACCESTAPVPVTRPTCSSHTCPEGYAVTNPEAECQFGECSSLQCCVPMCRSIGSCSAGWTLNWDNEFEPCPGGVCQDEFCCHRTCALHQCGAGFVSDPTRATAVCPAGGCMDGECCMQAPPPTTGVTVQAGLCGDLVQLSGAAGSVSHPANGGNYQNNEDRCWAIGCSGSVMVTLVRVDLEETYDFLYLSTLNAAGAATEQARIDGTLPPPPSTLDGNVLVRFTSDAGVTRTGFELQWTCTSGGGGGGGGPAPTGGGGGGCGGCTDATTPDGEWHDSDGPEYNCAYYAGTEGACADYGDGFANHGLNANAACCACGGGSGGGARQSEPPAPSGRSPRDLPSSGRCGRRVRHPWSRLTCAERQQYIDAVHTLYTDPALKQQLEDFVGTHVRAFPYAHSTSAFLAWHRQYLVGYENLLRTVPGAECQTLPYWDWDRDSGNEGGSSVFRDVAGFGSEHSAANPHCNQCEFPNCPAGCEDIMNRECVATGPFAGVTINVRGDGGEWEQQGCITRAMGALPVDFESTDDLALFIRSTPDFATFRSVFEALPHSAPHIWVGTGATLGGGASPADPLFLVHHCNVDRIYAVWQDYWGHDNHPKGDLDCNHYAPLDDLADIEGRPAPSQLEFDSVMPMQRMGGGFMSFLTDRWTIRDVHHIHDMPGGNSYAYGQDALAFSLNRDASFWGTVEPQRSRAVRECDSSGGARDEGMDYHYTNSDLEYVCRDVGGEPGDVARNCRCVAAACDLSLAHHDVPAPVEPAMRAAIQRVLGLPPHATTAALDKALKKCGTLEAALKKCQDDGHLGPV